MQKQVLAFLDDLYEDLELWHPKIRLEEAGFATRLAGLHLREYSGKPLGIKDDLENAGAIWVDAPVVVHDNLISSRTPKDLAPVAAAMVTFLEKI